MMGPMIEWTIRTDVISILQVRDYRSQEQVKETRLEDTPDQRG